MRQSTNRSTALHWASVAVAVIILLTSGLVHGTWSGRWHESGVLDTAVAAVDLVPKEFADWQAEDLEGEPDAFAQAGARGYWTRRYTHARSKQSLLVILMCGRSGRMSVHTPEVCYQGAGYEVVDNPTVWTAEASENGQQPDTFWTAKFRKGRGTTDNLRLWWAWNSRGVWQAPANPRWDFRGEPFLYKLYVSQELAGSQSPLAPEFLKDFLPVLRETLLSPP